MHDFAYHRPQSLEDAANFLRTAEDPLLMAGGQTMIPTLKQRLAAPSDVIDLAEVPGLVMIDVKKAQVSVGAMLTHASVASSPEVQAALPALAGLAGNIGDMHVRNRGTLGGSIANNDPAADYPAALIGLGATVHTSKRQIAADDFFTALFETALAGDEIVTSVDFPVPELAAYMKFDHPASRYAVVGVFIAKFGTDVRAAVTGAGPCVYREAQMEEALTRDFSPSALADMTISPDGMNTDLYAGPEYRANLVKIMATRAVEAALKGGG